MTVFRRAGGRRTLQDIGKWRSGGTPSRQKSEYFGAGIPWVKSGDLKDGPIERTEEQITEFGSQNSSAKVLPVGTVSMALYGATIGKLGIVIFSSSDEPSLCKCCSEFLACRNTLPLLLFIIATAGFHRIWPRWCTTKY